MNRRSLLIGIGAALAAPTIVTYANIMPVTNRLIEYKSDFVVLPEWKERGWIAYNIYFEYDEEKKLILPSSFKFVEARP